MKKSHRAPAVTGNGTIQCNNHETSRVEKSVVTYVISFETLQWKWESLIHRYAMDETKALQGYKWSCLNACLKNGKNNLLRELVQKPEAESHNVQCLVQNRNRNILRSGNILFEIHIM